MSATPRPEAKIRFIDFEAFVTQETADKLTKAQSQIKADQTALEAVGLQSVDEDVLDELRSHHDEWATSYTAYSNASAAAIQSVRAAFETGVWEAVTLPEFDALPILRLLNHSKTKLSRLWPADNAAELLTRAERIASLEARKWSRLTVMYLRQTYRGQKTVMPLPKQ